MSARTLVIGTSPVLLATALHRQRHGESVTVVEAQPRVGGAWSTAPLDDSHTIEQACHLIVPDQRVYEWLEKDAGIELTDYDVAPRVRIWKFTIPMATRAELWFEVLAFPFFVFYCVMRSLTQAPRLDRLAVGWSEVKYRGCRLATKVMRGGLWKPWAPRTFAHGVNGCLEQLTASITAAGGMIVTNATVERVDVCPERRNATAIIDGSPRVFDRVVVSSGLASCDLLVGAQPVLGVVDTHLNSHLLLEVQGRVEPLSYIRFVADPALRRVSVVDLINQEGSREAGAVNTDRSLLMVQTRGQRNVAEVLSRLVAKGIVETGSTAREVRRFEYLSHDIRVNTVAPRLRTLSDTLSLVETRGDLVHNLRAIADSTSSPEDLNDERAA